VLITALYEVITLVASDKNNKRGELPVHHNVRKQHSVDISGFEKE
jgi:hypothetical protein